MGWLKKLGDTVTGNVFDLDGGGKGLGGWFSDAAGATGLDKVTGGLLGGGKKGKKIKESSPVDMRGAVTQERENLKGDLAEGRAFGKEVLGDGLGRLSDQQDVRGVRDLLKQQAEGMTPEEMAARRDIGIQQLQGQERKAGRQLSQTLSSQGVKGGVAAQAGLQLAAQGLQERRNLERDMFLTEQEAKRQGTTNFANFATNVSKFDLGQAAAEKNIELQSGLAFAQLGSNTRSQVRQNQSAEKAAYYAAQGGGGGKK